MSWRGVLFAAILFGAAGCAPQGQARLDGPWQPVPIALASSTVEAVDRACRDWMEEFPQEAQLVVIDARGAGKIHTQYAGPDRVEANCGDMTIDAAERTVVGGGGTSFGGGDWRILQRHELEVLGGYGSNESSVTSGRVGAGIAKVVIVMPGQAPITASLANGWFLAWWPGGWPLGTKAIGMDPLGQVVSEAPVE